MGFKFKENNINLLGAYNRNAIKNIENARSKSLNIPSDYQYRTSLKSTIEDLDNDIKKLQNSISIAAKVKEDAERVEEYNKRIVDIINFKPDVGRLIAASGSTDVGTKKSDITIKHYKNGYGIGGDISSGNVIVVGSGSGDSDKGYENLMTLGLDTGDYNGVMGSRGSFSIRDGIGKVKDLAGNLNGKTAKYDFVSYSGSGASLLPTAIMVISGGGTVGTYNVLDSCGSIIGMKYKKDNIGGSKECEEIATITASAYIWMASNGTDIKIYNSTYRK